MTSEASIGGVLPVGGSSADSVADAARVRYGQTQSDGPQNLRGGERGGEASSRTLRRAQAPLTHDKLNRKHLSHVVRASLVEAPK